MPDSTRTTKSAQVKVIDSKNQDLGVASLNVDKNANYKITLSPLERNTQYNFAYLIDVSDSMSGNRLQETKDAYISLTQSLANSGIGDVTQFAVIPFSDDASLKAPLNATDAVSTIENLSVDGFTNFTPALEKATEFFSTVPPGATNIAYFLSDGFSTDEGNFKKTAKALQEVADVRAYGFGAVNILQLREIDSNEPIILSDPSELASEFELSILNRDDISEINIVLDGEVVETIQPEQLEDSPLGLTYSGSIQGLNTDDDIRNKVAAEIIYDYERPNTTVDLVVATPQNPLIEGGNNEGEENSPEETPSTSLSEVDDTTKPDSNLPILNVENISIEEGNEGISNAEFTFELTSPATEEVLFSYETVDGTAISDSDYNQTSGQVTIPVGETTASINVEVNGDTLFESDEEFRLNLTGLSSATFENNKTEYSKVAVIENDDIAQSSSNTIQEEIQAEPTFDRENVIEDKLLNLETLNSDRVAISFNVEREALYDNTVGFYKIEDAEGTITDPVTGNTFKPSDGEAYAELAVQLREPQLELSVDNLSSTIIEDSLTGGNIYAPMIVADGNFETLEGDLSQVYFSFAQANADKVEHIRSLGDNTLGFEDLAGGGDNDFNDLIIRTEIAIV